MPRQLDDVPWPVATPRLVLRRATPGDRDAVRSYRSAPSVAAWLGPLPEDFDARFVAPERLDVLVVVERDGSLIGDLMIRLGDAWAPPTLAARAEGTQAELGWALRPEETGKGFATEAVEATLRICFDDLGLHRVTASCFADNVPSYRLMERVGMRREAANVRDALHPSGEWRDGYVYALLADEWRARHR